MDGIRYESELTDVAAQIGGAPGVRAFDGGSVNHRGVVVGARVQRAQRFAALGHLARGAGALHEVGVLDPTVAVGACDEATEQRLHGGTNPTRGQGAWSMFKPAVRFMLR